MKRLLVAAALAPLSFAAAQAQTTISTSTTTPLTTAASGDITITSAGAVSPSTSGNATVTAITINSNNSVDNEGSISVTETTTGDGTNEGIATGPFANGGNRTGILVSGAGPFTGDITNGANATITIVGENSAAIAVLTGLNGFIDDAGAITVTGGNVVNGNVSTDVTYGIFSAAGAPISGNVAITGAVTATGANATGVALNGGVGGSLDVDNTITATGYRSITPPASPSALAKLGPDQLAQGGPALSIGGNISGGVTIDAPVAASGNVSATPGGHLSVFGQAPALLIGGAQPITVGAGADGYALTVAGNISSVGDYPNVNATAVQIGGVNPLIVPSGNVAAGAAFSSVDLVGGFDVSGNISATSLSNVAGSGVTTAIEIGGNATVAGNIAVSGVVLASGGNTLTTGSPGAVTAIKIDPGGAVTGALVNSGNITAAVTGIVGTPGFTNSSGGTVGTAIAISDAGGGLSSIVNMGNITASITPAIAGTAVSGNATTTAIYENNTGAITVTQCTAVDGSGNCATSGNATFTPSITGAVDFVGTGAATLDLWGGNLTGAMAFGNSTGNAFDIENGGRAKGALTVASGGELALTIGSGQLFVTSPGNVSLSSLAIGSSGSLIVTGNVSNPTGSTLNVAGVATLDSGAQVGLSLSTPLLVSETFTVIETGAGNLTAGNVSSVLLGQIPFLESGNLTVTSDSLSITARPKTAAELGFNPAEAAMLAPFSKALSSDASLSADVLSKTDRASLVRVYDQFLPDYAGGPFETLVVGQQEIARAEAETPIKLQTDTTRGWVQEIGYLSNEATTSQVNGYQSLGFGFAGGIERSRGDMSVGVAASFLATGVQDRSQPSIQSLPASTFELGVYWRKGDGQKGLNVEASLNGGLATFGSNRYFVDKANTADVLATPGSAVTREAKASWLGSIVSANIGLGYQMNAGLFYARPEVSADYVALFESGYHEHGGGPAFDLNVRSRTSSQADVQADLVLGLNFGRTFVWRPELMVGYRMAVVGGPAATTANFANGSSFTLSPQFTDKGGFLGRLGLRASGQYADFSADAGGEFRSGYQTYNARAAARFLF